jgi:hypothetical protein
VSIISSRDKRSSEHGKAVADSKPMALQTYNASVDLELWRIKEAVAVLKQQRDHGRVWENKTKQTKRFRNRTDGGTAENATCMTKQSIQLLSPNRNANKGHRQAGSAGMTTSTSSRITACLQTPTTSSMAAPNPLPLQKESENTSKQLNQTSC